MFTYLLIDTVSGFAGADNCYRLGADRDEYLGAARRVHRPSTRPHPHVLGRVRRQHAIHQGMA